MGKFFGGLLGLLGVVVLLLLAATLWQGLQKPAMSAPPVAATVEQGDTPVPPTITPPTDSNPPPQSTSIPPGTTAWTCPGQEVENGGCHVTSTTDVPANACVDYDPRGDDHPVGSYDVIDTDDTRQRVEFTQPGQIVLPAGEATIYTNNYCPPY